jgi:hypothetical protein
MRNWFLGRAARLTAWLFCNLDLVLCVDDLRSFCREGADAGL